MADRNEMLLAFGAEAYFQKCAEGALSHVLTHNPVTMLIVFETPAGEVGGAAVPASKQVAKALADAIYSKLWAEEINGPAAEEEEVEGVVE